MNVRDHPRRRRILRRPDPSPQFVTDEARELRGLILETVGRVGEGYLLQGLGAADLLATLLFAELRIDPDDPDHPQRDRLVLSTAHNSVALYAALARRGFLPAEALDRYGVDGDPLEIIGSERVPGVEGTFGSLGQGLSVGLGMALAAKTTGQDWRVYVLLGDGEMQEGQTWEAGMAAAAHRADNLCLIVDLNQMQVDGDTESVLPMGQVVEKWRSFGWATEEVNGHHASDLLAALSRARSIENKPAAIVARTEPGYPISFLRGQRKHYAKLSADEALRAQRELGLSDAVTQAATVEGGDG